MKCQNNKRLSGPCQVPYPQSKTLQCRNSVICRTLDDLRKTSTKLAGCSPFSTDPSLWNIVNGVVAAEDVPVLEYDSVARKVMQKMIGQAAFIFSFSRKDKTKTLGETLAVKVTPD